MLYRNNLVYNIRKRCIDECSKNSIEYIDGIKDLSELIGWKDKWIPFETLPSYPKMMFMITKTKYEDFVK